jgi:hypothetical protein
VSETLGQAVDRKGVSEAFMAAAEMFCRLSGDVLKGKVHEHRFGPWHVLLNGTTEPVPFNPPDSMGAGDVPPIHCAVLYNGWLAGDFSPAGGWITAGEGANESTFIAACKAEDTRGGFSRREK